MAKNCKILSGWGLSLGLILKKNMPQTLSLTVKDFFFYFHQVFSAFFSFLVSIIPLFTAARE